MNHHNTVDKPIKSDALPSQLEPIATKSKFYPLLAGVLIALMIINSIAVILLHRQQQQQALWFQQFMLDAETTSIRQYEELEILQETVADLYAQMTGQQQLLQEADGWLSELAAENELLKKKLH
ncbi:hypothetical protein [Anoxynatronum sibiricum]|uniref:Uncharacterized protein n=1 Tax=Anoxynatronum sibiricum TaxID=210623 RepID=A0ABU9VV70_9CLOT